MSQRKGGGLLGRVRPDRSSLWLGALSLALASLYWVYTVSEVKSVKEVSVPLQFANVARDLIVVGDDARRMISVEFRGAPDLLKRVREEDVDARIDAAKLQPGPQVLELGQEHIRLPSSVELVRTFPKTVRFTLDRRIHDTLPLQPAFVGRPSAGLQVLSWVIEPPAVEVEGPETAIRRIKHLSTQPVVLDGRLADFETPVVPAATDPDITLVSPATSLSLRVVLGEKRGQRTLAPVPVKVLHAHLPVTLETDSLRVMVEGPESAVRGMTAQDVLAEVDAQGLVASEKPYQLRPALRIANPSLASRVQITGWTDRFVTVQVGAGPGPASTPPTPPHAADGFLSP